MAVLEKKISDITSPYLCASKLSMKAFGVYSMLAYWKEGSEISEKILQGAFENEGYIATRNALEELEKAGLLLRKRSAKTGSLLLNSNWVLQMPQKSALGKVEKRYE